MTAVFVRPEAVDISTRPSELITSTALDKDFGRAAIVCLIAPDPLARPWLGGSSTVLACGTAEFRYCLCWSCCWVMLTGAELPEKLPTVVVAFVRLATLDDHQSIVKAEDCLKTGIQL
jgi:hypothetical protein